jgi:hypothetical protein
VKRLLSWQGPVEWDKGQREREEDEHRGVSVSERE